jgi:hypothetical protein
MLWIAPAHVCTSPRRLQRLYPSDSPLQGLYSCRPFRERLLQYASANGGGRAAEDNILTALAELFVQVNLGFWVFRRCACLC